MKIKTFYLNNQYITFPDKPPKITPLIISEIVYEMTICQVHTLVTIVFQVIFGQLNDIVADMDLDRFLDLNF